MGIIGCVNYFFNNREIENTKNQYYLLKNSHLRLSEAQVILTKIDDLILLNNGVKVKKLILI